MSLTDTIPTWVPDEFDARDVIYGDQHGLALRHEWIAARQHDRFDDVRLILPTGAWMYVHRPVSSRSLRDGQLVWFPQGDPGSPVGVRIVRDTMTDGSAWLVPVLLSNALTGTRVWPHARETKIYPLG